MRTLTGADDEPLRRAAVWQGLIAELRPTRCDTNTCIVVDATGPLVVIRSTVTGGAMTATHEEWAAFLDRAKAGEFNVGD